MSGCTLGCWLAFDTSQDYSVEHLVKEAWEWVLVPLIVNIET